MSGLPAYIATNLAASALSVDNASARDASIYPATYVNDEILGTKIRASGDGTNITLDIDSSPFVSYDSVYIGNYNITSAGAIYIYAGTALFALSAVGFPTYRAKQVWCTVGTQTFRNLVQVQIVDTTMTDQIEVGEIVIGTRVELPRSRMWRGDKWRNNTGETVTTKGGVTWDYEHSTNTGLRHTYKFPESEYADFEEFSIAVGRSPFVYIPDVSTGEAYYGKKTNRGFHPQAVDEGMDDSTFAQWYQWDFEFESLSEGLTV